MTNTRHAGLRILYLLLTSNQNCFAMCPTNHPWLLQRNLNLGMDLWPLRPTDIFLHNKFYGENILERRSKFNLRINLDSRNRLDYVLHSGGRYLRSDTTTGLLKLWKHDTLRLSRLDRTLARTLHNLARCARSPCRAGLRNYGAVFWSAAGEQVKGKSKASTNYLSEYH
jgi:hypothetical protein